MGVSKGYTPSLAHVKSQQHSLDLHGLSIPHHHGSPRDGQYLYHNTSQERREEGAMKERLWQGKDNIIVNSYSMYTWQWKNSSPPRLASLSLPTFVEQRIQCCIA